MFEAIVGDVVGSKFEFFNYRDKDFKLFDEDSFENGSAMRISAVAIFLARIGTKKEGKEPSDDW